MFIRAFKLHKFWGTFHSIRLRHGCEEVMPAETLRTDADERKSAKQNLYILE